VITAPNFVITWFDTPAIVANQSAQSSGRHDFRWGCAVSCRQPQIHSQPKGDLFHNPDGSTRELDNKPGTAFADVITATHRAENVSTNDCRAILVEHK